MSMPVRKKQSAYSFLSMDNYNSLGPIIKNFMYETYEINVDAIYEQEEYKHNLQSIMIHIDSTNKELPLADKNRMAILNMRNTIFEKIESIKKANEAKKPISQQPPDISQDDPTPHAEMPIMLPPTPQNDREETGDASKNDDVFFRKLQDLEQRRKIHPINVSGANTNSPVQPQPQSRVEVPVSSASVQQATAPPAQAIAVQEQVIVAVPPPPRHGITYVIASWERGLLEHPDRASFSWNKALPTMIDPLGIRIAGMFLPISVCNYTPYITVYIEGASGSSTSCILSPDYHPVNRNRGWLRWTPMDTSLSYIKNVSSPWMIQLHSADNSVIPLGRDMMHIDSISIDVTNRSARLTLSPPLQDGDFSVGDQVWIYTSNEKKKTDVLSVSAESIEVRYQIPIRSQSMSHNAHEWLKMRIVNYSRQWSLILDLESLDNRK